MLNGEFFVFALYRGEVYALLSKEREMMRDLRTNPAIYWEFYSKLIKGKERIADMNPDTGKAITYWFELPREETKIFQILMLNPETIEWKKKIFLKAEQKNDPNLLRDIVDDKDIFDSLSEREKRTILEFLKKERIFEYDVLLEIAPRYLRDWLEKDEWVRHKLEFFKRWKLCKNTDEIVITAPAHLKWILSLIEKIFKERLGKHAYPEKIEKEYLEIIDSGRVAVYFDFKKKTVRILPVI